MKNYALPPFLSDMIMQTERLNILITGATGFVGHALARRLAAYEHNIYVLDANKSDLSESGRIRKFYQQDLTKPFKLDVPFDIAFHLAAYNFTHVGSALDDKCWKINVLGTGNLLKSAKIKNLVFLSTTKVYKTEGGTVSEDSPLEPLQDYEKSKLEAENVCRKKFNGKNLCIFRSVNIAGPGQAEKAVIPILFRNALQNKPITIFVPKESILQFVYIEDLIDLFEIVIQRGVLSGVYNVFSDDHIRLDDLAYKIINLAQSKSPVTFVNQNGLIFSKVISHYLKKTFGWNARATINDILNEYRSVYCREAYSQR